MVQKLLVEKIKGKYFSKTIKIFENPKQLLPITSYVAWKILQILNVKPHYPGEIAEKLKISEQNVYYHIHKLEKAGFIKVVREDKKQGALCKYYSVVSPAFGIELESEKEEIKLNEKSFKKLKEFLYEFIKDGVFNGSIVVGAPTQHGPYLTSARDSHYAVQLGMFLGNFCETGNRFIVKLDTEVKAESSEKRNMILIGGPITNIISNEINEMLRIKFKWENTWSIYSEMTNKNYVDEDVGVIAKIKNPWDKSKVIILLAGLKFEGTKSCIIALTQYYDKILEDYYHDKDFFRLIRGLDRDGDGKVDYIQMVE